jgi:hypothetical protein
MQQGIVIEPKIEVGVLLGSVLPSQTHPVTPEQRPIAPQNRSGGVRFSHSLCRSVYATVINQIDIQGAGWWQSLAA